MESKELLTKSQVFQRYNASDETLCAWEKAGLIHPIKVKTHGGHWRYRRNEIEHAKKTYGLCRADFDRGRELWLNSGPLLERPEDELPKAYKMTTPSPDKSKTLNITAFAPDCRFDKVTDNVPLVHDVEYRLAFADKHQPEYVPGELFFDALTNEWRLHFQLTAEQATAQRANLEANGFKHT